MQSNRIVSLVCVKLILCSAGFGQLVQWKAVGTIQFLYPIGAGAPHWLSGATLGQQFEISFLSDQAKPALSTIPPSPILPAVSTFSVSNAFAKIGSHSWVLDNPGSISVGNIDAQYFIFFNDTATPDNLKFELALNTNMHPGSHELPSSLPPVEDFNLLRYMRVFDQNGTSFIGAHASIDTVSLTPMKPTPVPEPSTYGSLGILALLSLVVRRRLRR